MEGSGYDGGDEGYRGVGEDEMCLRMRRIQSMWNVFCGTYIFSTFTKESHFYYFYGFFFSRKYFLKFLINNSWLVIIGRGLLKRSFDQQEEGR